MSKAFVNGANGTVYKGNPVGSLYTNGNNPAAATFGLIAATDKFPLLDVLAAQLPNPEYKAGFGITKNDGTTLAILAVDAPTLTTPTPEAGVAVDLIENFRMYMLWKYPSGIYYPLAYADWKVNFYATGPGPVNKIIGSVTADANYVLSNLTPDRMEKPIGDKTLAWTIIN